MVTVPGGPWPHPLAEPPGPADLPDLADLAEPPDRLACPTWPTWPTAGAWIFGPDLVTIIYPPLRLSVDTASDPGSTPRPRPGSEPRSLRFRVTEVTLRQNGYGPRGSLAASSGRAARSG